MLPRAARTACACACRRRFSSSLALTSLSLGEQPAVGTAPIAATSLENIFEDLSQEYKRIEVVVGGHSSSNNPAESLIRILREQRYDDARTLLRQFKLLHLRIPPRVEFASHAYRILSTQGEQSDWLDWFALSTRKADLSTALQADKEAYSILVHLLNTNTLESMHPFIRTAARQGYAKSVLAHVMPWLTAHRPDLAEDVWGQALLHAAEPNERSHQTGKLLNSMRNMMIRTAVQHGHYDRTLSMLEDFAALKNATASSSYPSTSSSTSTLAGSYRLNRSTILQLLSTLARANMFERFEKAHELVSRVAPDLRLCNRSTENYPLMLVRRTETDESRMLAQEAFVALRSEAQNDIFEPDTVQQGTIGWRDPANVARDLELREAVKRRDLEGAMAILSSTLEHDTVPSLDATALFFDLDVEENDSQFLQTTLALITKSKTKKWERGYWTSALMLFYLRRRQYEDGIELFMRIFDTHALPRSFVERFDGPSPSNLVRLHGDADGVVSREGSIKSTVDFGVPLHPHSLALAMQCAVPILAAQREWPSITELYNTLVRKPIRFPIVPSSRISMRSGLPTYDPYTFLPFLKVFSTYEEAFPLLASFDVIRKMSETLDVDTIPREHWTVLLMALSRRGKPEKVYGVVEHLRGNAFIEGLPRLREGQDSEDILDAVAWTGIMGGFGRAKRYEEALEVGRMMSEKGYAEDPVWVETVQKVLWAQNRHR